MKRLAIGILAHVDSGKTTLTEGLLYRAGMLRKVGRVDHGDAFLDTHELEKKRGITIFSKQAILTVGEEERKTVFTLLDTPGHIDFSAEAERVLQVLDYAILVVSGSEGVQSHTETLWRLLKRYRIPTFIFINKMDLSERTEQSILEELRLRLEGSFVSLSPAFRDTLCEEAAVCDEALMEEYLESGGLSERSVAKAIAKRGIFPCFFGSALKLTGLDPLLDALSRYTLPVRASEKDPFAARVFKITEDENGGRLTHMKILSGSLKVKSLLTVPRGDGENAEEKVNQIRIYSGSKYQLTEEALPGSVVSVTGLSAARPGTGLGSAPDAVLPVLQPVLTYRVIPQAGMAPHLLLSQLRKLEEEDPSLSTVWNAPLQEIHIQLMGEVQLDILKSLMKERFGTDIDFDKGSILYKETVASPSIGIGHFEPLRHYAEVQLLIEPAERGSGLQFASDCREDVLDKNWQRLILTHLAEKRHIGVLTGSPLTDVKITLLAGRAHIKHTEGGDFRQATYRAVRQGLARAESVLLEPWYRFRLRVPSASVGRALTDMQKRNGTISSPEIYEDTALLTGLIPAESVRGYQIELLEYTKGKGQISLTLEGYFPCHNTDEVVKAVGYDFESDLDNPANSVFCAHGAGFTVKWDEVEQYSHIEIEKKREEEERNAPLRIRRAGPVSGLSFEDDKELLSIFERTYGPIRKSGFTDTHTEILSEQLKADAAKTPEQPQPVILKEQGPEYLLVDGYNIIYAWEELRALSKESFDLARSALIRMLCSYQGWTKCELILVFDAYKVKNNPGSIEKHRNISVVFTKEAETADMYIERVTHELQKKRRVRVATSDGMEQIIILGHGALRVSAEAFHEEMKDVLKAIGEYLTPEK